MMEGLLFGARQEHIIISLDDEQMIAICRMEHSNPFNFFFFQENVEVSFGIN